MSFHHNVLTSLSLKLFVNPSTHVFGTVTLFDRMVNACIILYNNVTTNIHVNIYQICVISLILHYCIIDILYNVCVCIGYILYSFHIYMTCRVRLIKSKYSNLIQHCILSSSFSLCLISQNHNIYRVKLSTQQQ